MGSARREPGWVFLIVQTAEEMLWVPGREVASLMPAYPNRWRVVLADGRVGHRTGDLPAGPWVRLGTGWVNPEWMVRERDGWRDPGGFFYAYEPLGEAPEESAVEEDLPVGLLTVEKRGRQLVWRTDSGDLPCELKLGQLLELYPQLLKVAQMRLVYQPRVRRLGARSRGGWLELDQGERILVGGEVYTQVCARFGLHTMSTQDAVVPWKLWRLREYPYDLTSAPVERIQADLSTAQEFAEQLLWQAVVRTERGESTDYGKDTASFARHPLASAGARCGYEFVPADLSGLLKNLVTEQGIVRLRQLGFRELEPERRMVGWLRPEVLLVAPRAQQQAARRAAEQLGISLLVTGEGEQLALEYLAVDLKGPLQLVGLESAALERVRERLGRLELDGFGLPMLVPDLDQLASAVARLPKPWAVGDGQPFTRVALEGFEGLVYVEPAEITSWSPSRPNRWRVELNDGRGLHHPGPIPPLAVSQPVVGGPALPCPAEQIFWLENREGSGVWHLGQGREVSAGLSFEEAARQHPELAALTRQCQVNRQHIRCSRFQGLILDDGQEFPIPRGLFGAKLRDYLGVKSFFELAPDPQGLRTLQLRDVPYEIARAEAGRLRQDFSGFRVLIANVIWQVHCGLYRYSDNFSGFFYRPLQALLYRAGYLTRAQLRSDWRAGSAKDRMYAKFCTLLTRMVYEYRLFTYREFGFKDNFPENRILGKRYPQRILLVEKGDRLGEYAHRIQKEFDVSMLILQGMPSLLATEHFVHALSQIYQGEVEVYFYGDFDFAGWDIGPAFLRQLAFYGMKCRRLERLVLASIFTPEERNLYSRPLDTKTPEEVSRMARWLREGGGVDGKPRGISANWLQPFQRVRQRFGDLLG